MYIIFKDKKLEKLATANDPSKLIRTYGPEIAKLVVKRLGEIQQATDIGFLVKNSIGRCHPLSKNRHGQFAMDLKHPFRLIFEPEFGENQQYTDWPTVSIAVILEVTDYHGN